MASAVFIVNICKFVNNVIFSQSSSVAVLIGIA
jgi:hypothetical protein